MKRLFVGIMIISSVFTNGFAQTANKGSLNNHSRVKVGLNFFSFDTPIKSGKMDIFDVINYASSIDMECVDITGYYFPGYPKVPSDEYIYEVKRCAFRNAIDIVGTGVKNDFCNPDIEVRKKQIQLVKDWIVVGSKLGASTIRIFSGPAIPKGYTWEQAAVWIAEATDECAEFGKKYGVMVAMQNHDDFLKTASEVNRFLSMCKSDNVGLMLDIGCFRTSDPYVEIESVIHRAITWQIKENVFINQVETKTDISKLIDIIKRKKYCGYLPIETLGKGTEKERVKLLYDSIRKAIEK